MKKLSVLIAIALMVTVGGVYAAWNYAQGTTASVEITREINMAQVNTNGNKGTISATPSDFAFLVDDDGTGTYKAVLKGTGKLDITFTPNPGADSDTATQGIKMRATIEVKTENGLKYNNTITPIETNTENKANIIDLEGGAVTKTATLTATQILNAVKLANVNLTTKTENDKFHTALKDYTIYITISEVVE